MAGAILILTQMPDRASAQSLARSLVETRLAACVSVGAAVESLYHWHGQIETAQEVPVVVKTRPERYREVETAIKTSTSLIEPIMVAGMGGIIGMIALAMLLPIFKLSTGH